MNNTVFIMVYCIINLLHSFADKRFHAVFTRACHSKLAVNQSYARDIDGGIVVNLAGQTIFCMNLS